MKDLLPEPIYTEELAVSRSLQHCFLRGGGVNGV